MSEYTAEMAHAAAARGAAWMDKHCPDWVSEIEVESLRLHDASLCVLGQTAQCLLPPTAWKPNYSDVVMEFWPRSGHISAVRLGFNLPAEIRYAEDNMPAYEMLTIAWKELIRQRLEAQPK